VRSISDADISCAFSTMRMSGVILAQAGATLGDDS
jgi:hypothetical protein